MMALHKIKQQVLKLSVIIVSYNVKHYLEQCLLSLERAVEGIETEIFVVDNHSRDESVEYLSERFPEVNFIASNHNLGFSRANNMAIRQCVGQYVLLLNPDTVVAEDTIGQVLGFMDEHPKVGGVGVKMLKTDGVAAMESRRGLPTPMTSFYKMSGLCNRYPESRRFGHYYMSYLSWDEPVQIEVISGAFFMLRHEALDKIGLLDEDFFMYGEDIDLSYRLLKAGYENWYVPAAILHYKGESTQRSSFRYVHVFYEAMLIFFRKHYGHLSLVITAPIKAAIYVKATIALVKMQMGRIRKSLGFVNNSRNSFPLYVFIGSRKTVAKCKQMARRKGLDARFVEGDAQRLPDGHVGMDLPKTCPVNVVYDIDAYRFEDVFRIFSASRVPNVTIGTYNPKTRIVITGEEVLK